MRGSVKIKPTDMYNNFVFYYFGTNNVPRDIKICELTHLEQIPWSLDF